MDQIYRIFTIIGNVFMNIQNEMSTWLGEIYLFQIAFTNITFRTKRL